MICACSANFVTKKDIKKSIILINNRWFERYIVNEENKMTLAAAAERI